MKATNIQWDIDMDEVYELLDDMTTEDAANALSVSKSEYEKMTEEERNDTAYDLFRHCPAKLDEFLELPSEIEIPKELKDDEDISDWLSDEYGYCHSGFDIVK